jgi:hypothetical protein
MNQSIYHSFGSKGFESSNFKEIEVGHVCLKLMVGQHGTLKECCTRIFTCKSKKFTN